LKCPKCQFENPDNTKYCGNCSAPLTIPDETLEAQTETLATPMPDITRGSVLNERYEIIEEIGKGGMGKVYKAFDKDINENIALKIIRPEIASNALIIARFQNELKMARKVAHRNVCKMYDLGKDGDTKYISMEYVPGEDLKTTIKRMGPLTIGKAISVAKQVCEGLAEAHRLGVIHRDLKPRNIMVDREGNARIMDFGIAISHEVKEITDSRIILGTPHYMSPEQVSGKPTDLRSDIYSLGIIMFEMVTGQVPFDGDTTISIALKHRNEQPPDPGEINYRIPDDLSHLILKCLEKDKEKRYQSANEVLLDLNKIEDEIPTTERIQIRDRTRTKRLKSRYRPVGIAAIAIGVIIIIISGYLLLNKNQKEQITPAVSSEAISWSNSIAILPFKDLSPEGDQEYLCESMMGNLITKLRTLSPDLKVISMRAVLKYKDRDVDVSEIGKELTVESVLEGSLQIEGDRILVNAWLTNAEDNSVIWPFEYEGKFESVLDVQDQITVNIARELKLHFESDEIDYIRTSEPNSIDAYVFYAKGSYYGRLYERDNKEEDLATAVSMYGKTIELDPNFALAYWGLGNIYEARYVIEDRHQDLESMFKNYEEAYNLAPNLAECNTGMGWYYFYKRDNDNAYKHYKKAFEIKPNDPLICYHIGGFLRSIGLYRNAIKYYTRAIELDPLDIAYLSLRSSCYRFLGEYEKSTLDLEEMERMEPDDLNTRLLHARLLIWMKRHDDAEQKIREVEQINSDYPIIRYPRALLYAIEGEREKALELIKGEMSYAFSYLISNVHAVLGMNESAIQYIRDGRENGFDRIKTYLYTYIYLINNPFFEDLHGEPLFQNIVQIAKDEYEECLAKYKNL